MVETKPLTGILLCYAPSSTTAIYLQVRPNHHRKEYEKASFDKLLTSR